MWYFAIYCSEDGEVSVTRLSQQELESRLNEEYWGPDVKFLRDADEIGERVGLMIIKGDLIIPQPKKVVEQWAV